MKRHKTAPLWLLGFLLMTHTNLTAQGTFQKTVSNLGHCNGQTILNDGSLRFGGHSNSGPQETVEQTIAVFPHPNDITRVAYGMIYKIKNLQGNIIFRYARLIDFPWNASQLFRDWTTSNQAEVTSIENHPQFVANASPTEKGRDYDLMAYKGTLDLELTNERTFGSPLWMEQWQFGQIASIHRSMTPEPTGDFFVGASAQQVLGSKTSIAVARIDNSHQLKWNTQIKDVDPDYPGHLVFQQSMYVSGGNELLIHGPRGWFPSRVYWLDASNGNIVRSKEYDVGFFGRVHTPYFDHVIQDQSSGNDDLNFIGHTIFRQNPANVAEIRMVYLRSTRQGILQTQQAYRLNGEQLIPTRIHQRNFNSFLITGEIKNMTTEDSDGLLMEIDRNGTPQWARRIHFASHEECRDLHIDLNGDIWVLGETNAYQTNPFQRNLAMFKFDGTGNLLNAFYYLKTHEDEARSLLVTGAGDFILEGIQRWGIERYYLRTDFLGKGPRCSTVEFNPIVTSLNLLTPVTSGATQEIKHLEVTHPNFTEQDFEPKITSVECPECDCSQ